jgi:hypothetical protein
VKRQLEDDLERYQWGALAIGESEWEASGITGATPITRHNDMHFPTFIAGGGHVAQGSCLAWVRCRLHVVAAWRMLDNQQPIGWLVSNK